jgi:hypothetical protein
VEARDAAQRRASLHGMRSTLHGEECVITDNLFVKESNGAVL